MPLAREDLINYLADRHGIAADEIDDQTALFSSRLLDSFAMVELMTFVETQAGIRFKPTEVNLDNLDSVGKILAIVEKKKSATPQ